jgi:pyrroline-5-carboxylate reductase
MAATSGQTMDEIVRRVASPNGTTEAGLAVLDRDQVLDQLVAVTIDAAGRRGPRARRRGEVRSLAGEAQLS